MDQAQARGAGRSGAASWWWDASVRLRAWWPGCARGRGAGDPRLCAAVPCRREPAVAVLGPQRARRGHVHGEPWATTTLRRVLGSGRISGQREHHGEIVAKADWRCRPPTTAATANSPSFFFFFFFSSGVSSFVAGYKRRTARADAPHATHTHLRQTTATSLKLMRWRWCRQVETRFKGIG